VARRRSRKGIIIGVAVLLALALAYAFVPRPTMVDIGTAERRAMAVTIDEEAKTRVRDAYVVSAPIAGRLMRVEVEPGDEVEGGRSVIAQMLPTNPSALDIRTREQARAVVGAGEAALRAAKADLNKAIADEDLAELELRRMRTLREKGAVAEVALDRAERTFRAASAALDTAKAAISMREADLANARAQLISFDDQPAIGNHGPVTSEEPIPLTAPVSGRILHVMQESATTLSAGTPIMEIGDIANDLEIVTELLSTDAVRVSPGDRVVIARWGGPGTLSGVVERVEPWGFTKFSALGVEEQRVKAIIGFSEPRERREKLGHGFRVETEIVIWEAEDALTVPSSALFREDGGWAVLAVEDGRARLRTVEVGHNNGELAEILGGVEDSEQIVLYPGPGLEDGASVQRRQVE
jgi:HlyD family secretion protein